MQLCCYTDTASECGSPLQISCLNSCDYSDWVCLDGTLCSVVDMYQCKLHGYTVHQTMLKPFTTN